MYFDSLKFKIIRHLLKKALRYNSATRRIWLIYLARIMASHTFPVCATRYARRHKDQRFRPKWPFCYNYLFCAQSEKLWHQNYKLRLQNYKLRPQNYKLRLQNYKLRSQNYKLRVQNYKFDS